MESKELVKVQRLPAPPERVESGAVMFGDDWPGTFIRGKHAFYFAIHLRSVLASAPGLNPFSRSALEGLLDTLESSHCINNDAFPSWHKEES